MLELEFSMINAVISKVSFQGGDDNGDNVLDDESSVEVPETVLTVISMLCRQWG